MSVGLVSSTSPDYPGVLATAINQLGAAAAPVSLAGATDAVLFPNADNLVQITATSVDAATLATPAAADLGKTLTVVGLTAHAHTVTAASGKIIDGTGTPKTTATFAAHAGVVILLQAVYDGTNYFWQLLSQQGVTLT
ncbi:MAG TPA: hypothetical protein VG206_02820 [Terriglobia bacterium]|nr:hypothetical protein [Terriglobia bacterium]